MDHPKKKAIIDACITEFAEHGYERANTNRICAEAGVSKGLIFHYFGSKHKLYLMTLEACLKAVTEPFRNYSVKDMGFVPAMLSLSTLKIRHYSQHPLHYRMLIRAVYNPPAQLAAEIKELQAKYYQVGYDLVKEMMGELILKPGVDSDRAMQMIYSISAIIEGKFMNVLSGQTDFSEEIHREMEREYMGYLKLLMYGIAEESSADREAFHE